MQYTGRLLDTKAYGDFKEILPHLTFPCVVHGKQLTAKILGQLRHPLSPIYRIEFSDGYTSDFSTTDGGYWMDSANEKEYRQQLKHPYSPYIKAIEKDLDCLIWFEITQRWFCFQTTVEGELTNVFVLYEEDEERGNKYTVRYNGEYQFTLVRRSKKWFAANECKAPGSKEPDAILARNISLLIEEAV